MAVSDCVMRNLRKRDLQTTYNNDGMILIMVIIYECAVTERDHSLWFKILRKLIGGIKP